MRRTKSCIEAMNSHAVAGAMVCSKSLARRRLRPSHAKVRSTTQRLAQLVTGIATICEYVSQPWIAADNFGQNERCAIAVLHVSGVTNGMNKIAVTVGHDVTLSALDLLARIIAARPVAFRRLAALAVDDPSARRASRPTASRLISSRA